MKAGLLVRPLATDILRTQIETNIKYLEKGFSFI